jgi:curli biogenesis system outer membrane secretion channel CsgG
MNKIRISSVAIAALTAVAALAATTPAQAADFAVTADKSANLAVAGDTVTVTLANLPARASTCAYVPEPWPM